MKRLFERMIDWLDRRRGKTDAESIASPYRAGVRTVTDAPLPVASRWLLTTLVALLLATLAWATFGRIDVTGTAQGMTIVNSRVKPIQAPSRGVVREILVEEGDQVTRDQALIRLDDTAAAARVRELTGNLARARAARARLKALLKADAAMEFGTDSPAVTPEIAVGNGVPEGTARQARALMHDQWRSYRNRIRELQSQKATRRAQKRTTQASVASIEAVLPYLANKVERLEKLTGSDSVSQQDLDDARQQWVERRHRLQVEKSRLEEANAELALMNQRIAAAQSTFREEKAAELSDVESQLASTEQKLAKARNELEMHAVRSPIDGIVQDVSVHAQRAVVRPADTLMRVVPKDRPVEVEAKILNRDIGFASVGQEVGVKFQAYDFTRYGEVPGVIREIAPTSTENKQLGRVYSALIELERRFIEVAGKRVPLRPGLTATVDLDMGSRRIIAYFLEPMLRYKDEALSER